MAARPDAFAQPPDSPLRHTLLRIFHDVLGVVADPQVHDVHRDRVPAWDSFNHVHLMLELEGTFGISIDDEEALGLRSLRDVEDLVERKQCGSA